MAKLQPSTLTFSQRLIARVMEKRVVAYVIVGATIVGGIATFFGSIDKLLVSYTSIEKWLSGTKSPGDTSQRAPSLWIRIDELKVIDSSGMQANVAKAGYFVRVPLIPHTSTAILDPLPLKVETSDGTPPPPRQLPRRDPYAQYDPVSFEEGIYQLLDVEQVLMPSGKYVYSRKEGEMEEMLEPADNHVFDGKGVKERVVFLDENYKEVTFDKVKDHKETWGRLANRPEFHVR